MRIESGFDYDASYDELADEFCTHDSSYQAETINEIGLQFKIWARDKKRNMPAHRQILEIAGQLNDDGKRFIKELYECTNSGSEGSKK